MASCGRVISHLPSSLTVLSSVYLTLFKLNLSRGCQTHDYLRETYRMFASVRGGRRMDFASTLGARPPYASRILSRNHCRSAPDSRPQCRIPPSVSTVTCSSTPPLGSFFFLTCSTMRPASFSIIILRSSSLPGSGRSVVMSAARLAASGRRAGQMCSVEICPCRTFFSCTESSEVCFSGKSTSIRRFPWVSCSSVVSMLYILFRCGENCSFVDHEALLLVYDQFLERVLYATQPGLWFGTLEDGIEPVTVL